MKKIIVCAAVLLATGSFCQAQIGRAVLNAATNSAKKTVEKNLTKKAEDAAAAAVGNLFGKNNTTSTEQVAGPTDFMAKVPSIPTIDQTQDYAVQRALNPNSLKLMVHPVARFVGKATMASIEASSSPQLNGVFDENAYINKQLSAYGIDAATLNNMSEEEQEAFANKIAMQQLSAYGLTSEDIEAMSKMSEEEAQTYLLQHMNTEKIAQNPQMQQMAKEAEKNMKDYKTEYELLDKYYTISATADSLLQASDIFAHDLWKNKYGEKKLNEKELVEFYKEYIPVFYANYLQAQSLRKNELYTLGKTIDESVLSTSTKLGGDIPMTLMSSKAHQAIIDMLNDCMKFSDLFNPNK